MTPSVASPPASPELALDERNHRIHRARHILRKMEGEEKEIATLRSQ